MAQSSGQGSPLPGEELHNSELPENPANFDNQVGKNEIAETLGAGITLDSSDRGNGLGSEQSGADRGFESVESDAVEPGKAADSVRVNSGQIPQTFKANATEQMPQKLPANATNFGSQMPQTWQASNATNATTGTLLNTEFAQPSGWGKLWRLERNGNYCNWRLRFTDGKETPKEFQRITRPGGKITARIEAKFAKRKGKGRHAESRADADRFRGRALDLAKRIRSISGSRGISEIASNATIHNPGNRDSWGSQMPQLRSLDDSNDLSGVWKSDRIM